MEETLKSCAIHHQGMVSESTLVLEMATVGRGVWLAQARVTAINIYRDHRKRACIWEEHAF